MQHIGEALLRKDSIGAEDIEHRSALLRRIHVEVGAPETGAIVAVVPETQVNCFQDEPPYVNNSVVFY